MRANAFLAILFSLASILFSHLHGMEKENKSEKSAKVVIEKCMQPLGLKAACLELYSKQNVPDNILPNSLLPRTLGFITSASHHPKLRLEILKELKPEIIEAAAEDLVFFVRDQIVKNLASEQTEIERELIKRLPIQKLEPIVDNLDFIFNAKLNATIKILLINKLSPEFCQKHTDKLIALFNDQETPHEIRCALFERIPELLNIKHARDLMLAGPVSENLITSVGEICKHDKDLISLWLNNIPAIHTDNQNLLKQYFIDRLKDHLASNLLWDSKFCLKKSSLANILENEESIYNATISTGGIITIRKIDSEETLFNYQIPLFARWAVTQQVKLIYHQHCPEFTIKDLVQDLYSFDVDVPTKGLCSLSSDGRFLAILFEGDNGSKLITIVDLIYAKTKVNSIIDSDSDNTTKKIKIITNIKKPKIVIQNSDNKIEELLLPVTIFSNQRTELQDVLSEFLALSEANDITMLSNINPICSVLEGGYYSIASKCELDDLKALQSLALDSRHRRHRDLVGYLDKLLEKLESRYQVIGVEELVKRLKLIINQAEQFDSLNEKQKAMLELNRLKLQFLSTSTK